MATYSYRVLRKGIDLAIYEVYFDSEGKPDGCSEGPVPACATTIEDLRFELGEMLESLNYPVLNYDDL